MDQGVPAQDACDGGRVHARRAQRSCLELDARELTAGIGGELRHRVDSSYVHALVAEIVCPMSGTTADVESGPLKATAPGTDLITVIGMHLVHSP